MSKKTSGSPRRKTSWRLKNWFSAMSRGVGRALGNAVEWIEGRFANLAAGVGDIFETTLSILVPKSLRTRVDNIGRSKSAALGKHVGELTEKVEKRFTKSASGVSEILGYVASILVPAIVRVRVAQSWKSFHRGSARLFSRIGKTIRKYAERFLPKWLFRFVERTSKSIRRARQNTMRFIGAWWKSRNFSKLAWAAPAILLATPLMACLTLATLKTNSDKIVHYRRVAFEADVEGATEMADLFRRKLQQLGYLKIESEEYLAALQMEQRGDYSAAYERMKKIAPLPTEETGDAISDAPAPTTGSQVIGENETDDGEETEIGGHVFAHLWICSKLLEEKIDVETTVAEKWKQIEARAKCVQKLEPSNLPAKYYLLKADENAGIDVVDRMLELANEYPQFSLELMHHYYKRGELGSARTHAQKYIRYIEGLSSDRLTANHYVGWSAAYELLGDKREAERVALDGNETFPDAEILQKIASAVWFIQLQQMDPADTNFPSTLRRAHAADPNNLDVAGQLARRLVYDQENSATYAEMTADLEQKGRLSPNVYLIAGDLYAARRRWEEAMAMYRAAIRVDENSAQAHNNVAWVLANLPPIRLEEALVHAEKAIAIRKEAQFFETRGQIFSKLEQWQSAAVDLERALNGQLPAADLQNAHKSLVQAYEKLGQPELAAAHRELAGM